MRLAQIRQYLVVCYFTKPVTYFKLTQNHLMLHCFFFASFCCLLVDTVVVSMVGMCMVVSLVDYSGVM
jgi:hypothetical protein